MTTIEKVVICKKLKPLLYMYPFMLLSRELIHEIYKYDVH